MADTQIDDNDDDINNINGDTESNTISTEGSELYASTGTLKKLRDKIKTAFIKDNEYNTNDQM